METLSQREIDLIKSSLTYTATQLEKSRIELDLPYSADIILYEQITEIRQLVNRLTEE